LTCSALKEDIPILGYGSNRKPKCYFVSLVGKG
jgi:hypothetical protein